MVKAITQNLKVTRIKAGLFQEDVANGIGITQNAYALIETGRRTTTGKTAKAISDFLNVTFDDLFTIERSGG